MGSIEHMGVLGKHRNVRKIDTGDKEYTYYCEICKKVIGHGDRHTRCIEIKECER